MDIKDRRHRSLTRGRCGKECRYTSSSLDSEDCRVPTQKSYSSSETLKAYDHDTRMHYGNRVTDLVHRESDEFPRQGMLKAFMYLSKTRYVENIYAPTIPIKANIFKFGGIFSCDLTDKIEFIFCCFIQYWYFGLWHIQTWYFEFFF